MDGPKQEFPLFSGLVFQDNFVTERLIMNIHELRQNNYKVRVFHARLVQIPVATPKGIKITETVMSRSEIEELVARGVVHHISAKGGFTRVEVTSPNGDISSASSLTHPKKDSFSRKRGLSIALGRAMAKLNSHQLIGQ